MDRSFHLRLSLFIRSAGLFINVVRPANVPTDKLLPVIFVGGHRSRTLILFTISSLFTEVAIVFFFHSKYSLTVVSQAVSNSTTRRNIAETR
jgi:1-acyl-sn-glycerol-3-phosphate acyltransferase